MPNRILDECLRWYWPFGHPPAADISFPYDTKGTVSLSVVLVPYMQIIAF